MSAPLKRESRWIRVVITVSLFAFLGLFSVFPKLNPMPFCGFRVLTGLPCPLCGGTRAAYAALHGNFPLAMYLNPIAIGVVGLMVAIGLIAMAEAVLNRPLANWPALWHRWSRTLPVILIVGLLIWWPFHIGSALTKPKTELINLGNPVAHACWSLAHGEKK